MKEAQAIFLFEAHHGLRAANYFLSIINECSSISNISRA